MFTQISLTQLQETAAAVRSQLPFLPKIGLILGSGLGQLVDQFTETVVLPYATLPHWPVSTVAGHVGQLVCGKLEGVPVLAMKGRIHFYEGYSQAQVVLPVRVMHLLGIETLIITNAAGGLNPNFAVGDVMAIVDHIHFGAMAGFGPLIGKNIAELGERFPAMTAAYAPALLALAVRIAAQANIPLQQGVYIALAGPCYETPAEVRFLQRMGGDAVGMSTASETIAARHAGMQVLAFSGITNICDTTGLAAANHAEVLTASEIIVPKLTTLLRGVVAELATPD